MSLLPTIDLCGTQVSRLICGGNPIAGFSHFSDELDREMVEHYTMPSILALMEECWKQGINTIQTRGDRHMLRAMTEYRLAGGRMNWIFQTASEFRNLRNNIRLIARQEPIAIYNHGTHTDNCFQERRMEEVLDQVKAIKDHGLPAGVGTHMPEVIEHIEEQGWPVDFYMGCFYRLAGGKKRSPATDKDPYAREWFDPECPPKMTKVLRAVSKPCLGFKLFAAGRTCGTSKQVRQSIQFAFDNLKPTDAVVIGMFQKHKNQVAENAGIVRDILSAKVG